MVFLTFILLYPLLWLEPEEQASPNPPGEVYTLQEIIDSKFPSPVHFATFVIEAKDGDVLTAKVFKELKRNKDKLLAMDQVGGLEVGTLSKQPYLFSYFEESLGHQVTGLSSALDFVQMELVRAGYTLDTSTDEQIKVAIHNLLDNYETSRVLNFLSVRSNSETKVVNGQSINWWTSPAMLVHALAQNEKLGGTGLEIGLGGGPDVINKERLNRKILSIVGGERSTFDIWGVAIDVNLESEQEGKTAGVFIMFTVIAALLVVGLSFRSYWATAICGIGLTLVIIWLKGISGLVGIKSGLVIDLVVPIGMVSLGVDFLVHSMGRYKEELKNRSVPLIAFQIGLPSVFIALALAMLSDSIAFLSNLSSSIEAVIHFGVAAAIGVISSFIILGIVSPLLAMKIDEYLLGYEVDFKSPKWLIFRILASCGVACASGLAVILIVAVSKVYGLVTLGFSVVVFILVPLGVLVIRMKQVRYAESPTSFGGNQNNQREIVVEIIEKLVLVSVSNRMIVIVLTVIVTAASIWYALRLEPTFDVKDFFDSSSDFVIGLDKIDKHLGEKGGEPGVVYIEGDLMDPEVVSRISDFIDSLREVEAVAETPSGEITIGLNIVNVSRMVTNNPYAVNEILTATGIKITDRDRNGIPDTREQMEQLFGFLIQHGLRNSQGSLILKPEDARGAVYYSGSGKDLTTVSFQIPGTRDQSVVGQVENNLSPLLVNLEYHPKINKVGLTGSPFTRDVQLSASTKTLYTSLPIAVVAATLLLALTMRSVKYAVVTVIPVILVVVWLYGIMYALGFALNFVTAMIGAISIGVGIDYSIHMTQRYREELKTTSDPIEAIKIASRGTGLALVSSAASSIVGFVIMGMAPMPMFASFGQLTAIMIFLSLLASLVVLPSMLILVSKMDLPKSKSHM